MRIYLAAAWSRRDEIAQISEELSALSKMVRVDARWLEEQKSKSKSETAIEFRRQRAEIDISDVTKCDVLVRFTDDLTDPFVPAKLATGARMFEMGYAYALKKTVVVVGGHQPIFDYLPRVIHVKNVKELKQWILERVNG